MYKLLTLLSVFSLVLLLTTTDDNQAQVDISPTAQQVQIATATSLPTEGAAPTPVPPTFTPTDQGPPQLEPKAGNEVNGINVRADADIDSPVLGTIRTGERFVITGRVFRWIQFRYDPSPTGVGYVFDELVDIIGDVNAIPDLTQVQAPEDNEIVNATASAEVLQLTPGFEQTLTAEVRIIEAPSGESVPDESGATLENAILPTFTYPPNLASPNAQPNGAEMVNVANSNNNAVNNNPDGVAPIVPIVLLGGAGLIGLLLSRLRR